MRSWNELESWAAARLAISLSGHLRPGPRRGEGEEEDEEVEEWVDGISYADAREIDSGREWSEVEEEDEEEGEIEREMEERGEGGQSKTISSSRAAREASPISII